MKTAINTMLQRALILFLTFFIVVISISAQTTAFTYQGRLNDNSAAASGSYDMQFLVYTAATGGTQQGFTVTKIAVPVTNGVFTVQIDMSNSPFVAGENRFLEIRVRLSGSGAGYTTLLPRQQITSSPYAIQAVGATFAINAQNADALGNILANQFVQTNDTRLTDARTPTSGSTNYIQNTTTQQTGSFNLTGGGSLGGNFSANNATVNALTVNGATTVTGGITGNGANISGLNATNITLGALSDARLSSNIPRLNAANLFTNNVSVQGDFSVGGTLTGNGSGLTSLNAASVTTGTFSDTRLSSNIPRRNTANNFTGNQNITGTLSATVVDADSYFSIGGTPVFKVPFGLSNNFIGYGAGASYTSGTGNTFFGNNAGLNTQTGDRNTFIGVGTGGTNTTGSNNTLLGAGATFGSNNSNSLTYATAIGAGAVADHSNRIVLGRPGTNVNPGPDGVFIPGGLEVYNGLYVEGRTEIKDFLEFKPYPNTNRDACMLRQVTSVLVGDCSSSINFKKDVENFTSGLDLVRRLRPVTFTWKSDNSRDLGFIAEEVNEVEPLLATRNENGEIQGVKYKQISVALVNAVNEQQEEIKQQKEIIERQQKQIDALVKLMCAGNPAADVCREIQK